MIGHLIDGTYELFRHYYGLRRAARVIRDADGVQSKLGVDPELIPDYLALVGDASDGYPCIKGIGAKGAASLLARYGEIERFPPELIGKHRALAILFKKLATLRTDAKLYTDVDELEWHGPMATFPSVCKRLGATDLLTCGKPSFKCGPYDRAPQS